MNEAQIKKSGELVSVTDLIRRYGRDFKSKGIEIICPGCSKAVFVWGYLTSRTTQFHHYPNTGEGCPYAAKKNCMWGKPDSLALGRGRALKKQISEVNTLKQVYTFCNHLCGKKKRLSADKFCSLIKEADKRNIWSYKDIPLWFITFILLSLEDFEGYSDKHNKLFKFRFVLKGSTPTLIRVHWEKEDSSLLRVFEDGRVMDIPPGNPYPIKKSTWETYSQDSDWLLEKNYKALLDALGKCFE